MILDIHTHHPAPCPEAVVNCGIHDFNPVENQLYSVGIHPWDIPSGISLEDLKLLEEIVARPEVTAIGECGIDLLKGGPLFRQLQIMKVHVELSERYQKPLILHCVKANDIILGLHRDLNPSQLWAVHGFRGKPAAAEMFVNAGIYLSFGEKYNPEALLSTAKSFVLSETDESPMTIEEVISRLSETAGRDLTTTIAENSNRFLNIWH